MCVCMRERKRVRENMFLCVCTIEIRVHVNTCWYVITCIYVSIYIYIYMIKNFQLYRLSLSHLIKIHLIKYLMNLFNLDLSLKILLSLFLPYIDVRQYWFPSFNEPICIYACIFNTCLLTYIYMTLLTYTQANIYIYIYIYI